MCKVQLSLQICCHKLRFLMHILVDLSVLNNILFNLYLLDTNDYQIRITRNVILQIWHLFACVFEIVGVFQYM